MALSDVRPLAPGLPFGVRIGGLTQTMTDDPAVRDEINALFRQHAVILFEDVEPSDAMQLALSNVFGPLKEHPVKNVSRVDGNAMPGVVEIKARRDRAGWWNWRASRCRTGCVAFRSCL